MDDLTFTSYAEALAAGSNKLDPDQRQAAEMMLRNGWRWLLARSVADVQALFREIDSEAATTPDAGPARRGLQA